MDVQIARDDLSDGAVAKLLSDHLDQMFELSPASDVHALRPQELVDPRISFWSARCEHRVLGCCALKSLSNSVGELKAMKVRGDCLRRGIAQRLLTTILEDARKGGFTKLYLETGNSSAFDPAIMLYRKHGFRECGPFGSYERTSFSRFFLLEL
ncbi:MAG: GNAT family N-acetyltransferase [Pseudomonadota bacterium]